MAKHSYALRPVTKRCDVGAERGAQGRTPRALRGVATQRAWVFMGDHGTPGIELGGLGEV